MNRQEFKRWSEFHCDAFPEVDDWLNSRKDPDHPEQPPKVLDYWFEALSLVRFEDAMACTRLMLAGRVDHPNRFEISRLPGAIVKNTPYRCPPIAT